ncbi:MAG: UvrD-helicase domain-containing protein [Elusimicrobiota bacterium]
MELSNLNINREFIKRLGLNDRQLEAALYFKSPLLIIAGAGTGKTKTLISKLAILAYGGIPPSRILAITFTNKAAEEMRNRVVKLVPDAYGLWCSTFHSFGAKFLRMHYKEAGLRKDFVIYDEDDQKKLISLTMKEMGFEKDKNKAAVYLAIISRAKDDLLDSESYLLNARITGNSERIKVAQIYFEYQKKLASSNAVDFGDLISKPVELLKNNKELCEYYQNYFNYILVDEYQDTNRAQYLLIKTLSQKHKNLCVVGDPDQSIYGWRGADIRNILQFEADFKDAKTIALEQNYRSTSSIIDAANRVIIHNKNRKEKNLWTQNPVGEKVEIIETANEIEEAAAISAKISKLVRGGMPYKNIAVFYRTNAQSRNFEEYFRKNRIPYKLIGTVRFYERKEIKDAIAYLRVVVNNDDTISLMRVINTPPRGIGDKTIEKILEYSSIRGIPFFDALLSSEATIPPSARASIQNFMEIIKEFKNLSAIEKPHILMEKLLIKSGYWQMLEEEAEKDKETGLMRLANIQELVNAIKQFEDDCEKKGIKPTLEKYLEEISLQSDIDDFNENSDTVTLMTVHLAKGLEFEAVFVTGLEEGLFPINAANSDEEDMEEERRLMYVGMTRAKKKLFLSWAKTRRIFGKTYPNMMSRFIIEAEVSDYFGRKKEDDIKIIEAYSALKPKAEAGRIAIHPIFGKGKIIEVIGSGEFAKVKIKFSDGSIHTFMLKFAPIEII